MDSSEDDAWAPPAEFQDYRVRRSLGAGGMGHVFLAHDQVLDRAVAIKFVGGHADPMTRARLLVEARAAARLQHPNVVTVHGVGELDGHPYIVEEYIRGTSLDKLEKPVSWRQTLSYALDLARGLAAAHRHGVLHRDIKPANAILMEGGGVKLVDFGLAKLVAGPAAVTEAAIEERAGQADTEQGGPSVAASAGDESYYTQSIVEPQSGDEIYYTQSIVDGGPAPPPTSTPEPYFASDSRRGRPLDWSDHDTGNLTHPGAIMGTPYYIPPEIWRGEPASRSSDIYSLGVLLYELLVGHVPHQGAGRFELARLITSEDNAPLASVAPRVPAELAEVVDRCLFRDISRRLQSADELCDALELIGREDVAVPLPEGNPYRGLLPFEAEHRGLFFGRARDARALLELLGSEPFVLVAGESGVGKSSLVKAGVVPLIEAGAMIDGRRWSVTHLVPGYRPVNALIAALGRVPAQADEEEIEAALDNGVRVAARLVRRRIAPDRGVVVVIDQFEEFVTIADPQESRLAAELLGALIQRASGVRILATVRGDYLARIAALPGIGASITRALYLLRPLDEEATRETVVGPASATGVCFESDEIVRSLVASATQAEGGLPLLQFALAQLWRIRDVEGGQITAAHVASLGGVEGALARHADGVLAALLPEERAVARRVFVRLVTLQGTRARHTVSDLSDVGDLVPKTLESLVQGRLLVAREVDGETHYELAHEALLTHWDALRGWIAAAADTRAVRERIAAVAGEWSRLGRIPEAVWGERQLLEAEAVDPAELSETERAFLAHGRQTLRWARWRRRLALVAGLTTAAAIYGGVAWVNQRALSAEVGEHLASALEVRAGAAAIQAEAEALREEAFARFDAGERWPAEQAWAKALERGVASDIGFANASRELDLAYALDSARDDTSELLAGVLFERALAAEATGREVLMHEVVGRLEVYDRHGYIDRWRAPVVVAVRSDPAARVTIERYEASPEGPYVLRPAATLAETPAEVALPLGPYRLTIEAPDRPPVLYPILVGRGDGLTVDVQIPATLPTGFVYIPAGEVLLGTVSGEDIRQWEKTVPAHAYPVADFLIARDEVTFGEWIEFLRDLPADERTLRTPAAENPPAGNVSMHQDDDDRWILDMVYPPDSWRIVAAEGEPVRYEGRENGREQRWERMPVVGISWEDATAYSEWLDRTGRVPRARLCREDEWERAAGGADRRLYPHGDELSAADANIDITYARRSFGPDEVGSHPRSDSPFGVHDMAGNAFEMVSNTIDGDDDKPVVRGGAFYYGVKSAALDNRETWERRNRDTRTGARICADLPP